MTDAGSREALPVPVCPRHPDRESYVRCQRCERPVCAQCQRDAAVGVQCVDCVRESSARTPQARTTFGGRVGDGRPLVTWTLMALCGLVFVAQRLPGLDVTNQFAFAGFVAAEEPWRFVTAAFLHAPNFFFHILLNLYALYLLGPYLEDLLGRARFLTLYLLSAVGGSVGYLLLVADPFQGTVGASGAVFGLFGALAVVQRKLGRDLGQILVLIAINTAFGFIIDGIAWQAHLGGLVTGAGAAAVLAYAPRERRAAVQAGGLAAIGALLVIAAVLGLPQT